MKNEDIIRDNSNTPNHSNLPNQDAEDIGEEESFVYQNIDEINVENFELEDLDSTFEWQPWNQILEHDNNKHPYLYPKVKTKKLETPFLYFSLFFDNNVIDNLTNQTNIYASDFFEANKDYFEKFKNSRMKRWSPITNKEIK